MSDVRSADSTTPQAPLDNTEHSTATANTLSNLQNTHFQLQKRLQNYIEVTH